jgi:hypothetical protein
VSAFLLKQKCDQRERSDAFYAFFADFLGAFCAKNECGLNRFAVKIAIPALNNAQCSLIAVFKQNNEPIRTPLVR